MDPDLFSMHMNEMWRHYASGDGDDDKRVIDKDGAERMARDAVDRFVPTHDILYCLTPHVHRLLNEWAFTSITIIDGRPYVVSVLVANHRRKMKNDSMKMLTKNSPTFCLEILMTHVSRMTSPP
jgi:hypothetical protein